MNTDVEHTFETELKLLKEHKVGLQSLIALYNLLGDQAGAHRCSKLLCAVLSQEFQLNPRSRRTKKVA